MLDQLFEQFDETPLKAEIRMTPLIDMVFILLIFFVVTTAFIKETGIKVDKAKASTSQPIRKNLILIAIDRQGQYWYDNRRMDLDPLVEEVKDVSDRSDSVNVVLIPDKNGRVEPLVTIMDRLRANQIDRFSLGTRRPDAAELQGAGSWRTHNIRRAKPMRKPVPAGKKRLKARPVRPEKAGKPGNGKKVRTRLVPRTD